MDNLISEQVEQKHVEATKFNATPRCSPFSCWPPPYVPTRGPIMPLCFGTAGSSLPSNFAAVTTGAENRDAAAEIVSYLSTVEN